MAGKLYHTKDLPGMPARKPASRVNFNFDEKHGSYMPDGAKVGGKLSLGVSGTVKGISSHDYGHSLDMELDGPPNPMANEPSGLVQAMKARKRHPASGRYVVA